MVRAKFGIRIPFSSAAATMENVVTAAKAAEDLGYPGIVTGDHVNCELDRHLYHRMGRGVLGEPGNTNDPNFFESMTTLAYIGGMFPSLELLVGVMLLPIRNPILLAKQAANIDAFTKGRLRLGVGVGNATDRVEFDIMGLKEKMPARYDMATEWVESMKRIWTDPMASYDGKFINFKDATVYPKPFKNGHIPLWVGGISDRALNLIAKHCDGWWAALPPIEEIKPTIEKIRELRKAAGRGSDSFTVANMFRISIAKDAQEARSNVATCTSGHKMTSHWGVGRAFVTDTKDGSNNAAVEEFNKRGGVGNPSDVMKKIEEQVEAGVTYFDTYFMYPRIEHLVEQMKFFAKEVMPSFN